MSVKPVGRGRFVTRTCVSSLTMLVGKLTAIQVRGDQIQEQLHHLLKLVLEIRGRPK